MPGTCQGRRGFRKTSIHLLDGQPGSLAWQRVGKAGGCSSFIDLWNGSLNSGTLTEGSMNQSPSRVTSEWQLQGETLQFRCDLIAVPPFPMQQPPCLQFGSPPWHLAGVSGGSRRDSFANKYWIGFPELIFNLHSLGGACKGPVMGRKRQI